MHQNDFVTVCIKCNSPYQYLHFVPWLLSNVHDVQFNEVNYFEFF